MRLSSSQYSSASTCFKQFEYAHIDKLAIKPRLVRDSLRRGTWIHRALEIYHQQGDWEAAVADLYEWAVDHHIDPEKAQELRDEVESIVDGYIEYWRNHGERWSCELAEESLEATFGQHVLSARLDGVMRTSSGLFITENKSTSDIPSATWRTIDPQTAIQWVVCQANGIKIDGIIFNYLWTKVPPLPKWKKIPKGKTIAEPYAVTINAVTTSQAWELGIQEHAADHPGTLDLESTRWLQSKIVNDGAYYQRYVVYKQDALILGILRDVASTIRDLMAAEKYKHYRRLSNMMYCPRFCQFSQLCATELTTGRLAEVMREEDFVPDDGVISREGVAR